MASDPDRDTEEAHQERAAPSFPVALIGLLVFLCVLFIGLWAVFIGMVIFHGWVLLAAVLTIVLLLTRL